MYSWSPAGVGGCLLERSHGILHYVLYCCDKVWTEMDTHSLADLGRGGYAQLPTSKDEEMRFMLL